MSEMKVNQNKNILYYLPIQFVLHCVNCLIKEVPLLNFAFPLLLLERLLMVGNVHLDHLSVKQKDIKFQMIIQLTIINI